MLCRPSVAALTLDVSGGRSYVVMLLNLVAESKSSVTYGIGAVSARESTIGGSSVRQSAWQRLRTDLITRDAERPLPRIPTLDSSQEGGQAAKQLAS